MNLSYFFNIPARHVNAVANWTVVGYLLWTGILSFGETGTQLITNWFSGHILFSGFDSTWVLMAWLIGGLKLLTAIGLSQPNRHSASYQWAALTAFILFIAPTTLLLTNPVWVESYGGFPIIGSGQGIIKYFSMAGVALYLYALATSSQKCQRIAVWLCIFGVAIVMGWIGAMKFFEFEAQGISRLMQTNILFSWTYTLWSTQGASNFIGIVEIIFLLALLCAPLSRYIGLFGLAGIFATAFGTTTFILNTPGYEGFLLNLNSTGQFIIKDWLLFAAALIFYTSVVKRKPGPA
ncbi:DUF417 family protein [Microbulbifer sp. 2201CG32-9]|uniref:DUF417 family protein n=1 Tax=Microbulbifer sp. 2201CG32-9 TaxID=3232309 RepID=UPI00345BC38F